MSTRSLSQRLRRPAIAAAALALALGVSACGNKESHPHYGDNEGAYVDAGPITYQVQISRELNPFSPEDTYYLRGVTAVPPTPQQEWFAVFLGAWNQSGKTAATTTKFDLIDTLGHVYYPIAVNPAVNQQAWTAQVLKPGGVEPAPDTLPRFGPTQGMEVLFKINNDAYSNRPLALQIYAAGQPRASRISLDL